VSWQISSHCPRLPQFLARHFPRGSVYEGSCHGRIVWDKPLCQKRGDRPGEYIPGARRGQRRICKGDYGYPPVRCSHDSICTLLISSPVRRDISPGCGVRMQLGGTNRAQSFISDNRFNASASMTIGGSRFSSD
jgi:hypothetical protein